MTIRVLMTETRASGAATTYAAGSEYDLPNETAELYIYRGWATYVSGRDPDPVPVMAKPNPATAGIIRTLWVGTQAEYDAIAVKDANTQYNIVAA